MKIYIFADLEGISGIANSSFVTSDGTNYAAGRKYFTREINICAQACFDAGADEVVIRDGHWNGLNALWEDIHPQVKLIQGATPEKRFFDIENSDGMILLGYHAMAGTQNAVMEHTFSSKTIQNMWLNGERAGEFAIDTVIAGEYGVPVIMTSGCDKLCAEAKAFLPQVVCCEVKKSTALQGVMMLSPAASEKLLRAKVFEAIEKLKSGEMKPIHMDKFTLRTEFMERCAPLTGLTADRTTEKQGSSLEKLLLNL